MPLIRIVILLLLLTPTLRAQIKPVWNQKVADGVKWQMVTPLGSYLIGTSQAICGVNPDNGTITWRNPKFANVAVAQVQPVGSSPLIAVNLASEVYMLEPFSGQVRFDSKSAGIAELKDQRVLYKSNGILVSGRNAQGKDLLLMSSLEDGKVVWKIDDDFGRFITAEELAPDALLIVTLYYNYKVNPKTGQIVWKNDVSEANAQLAKMGGLGTLVKQAAANTAQNMNFNVRFYRHPSKPIFFIASEQEGKAQASSGFTTSTSTGSGPSYHTTYSAFDLNDGKRLWSKPLDINGKMGPVHFEEKGIVILPDDASNTKINMYDYTTQEGAWGKKGKGVAVKGGVYSYSKVGNDFLLVSQNTNGKNFISYFNPTTQLLTFDKPVQVDGTLVYNEMTPKGLFYISTQEINILNTSTGDLLLGKGIRTTPSLAAGRENSVFVFDLGESVLKVIDKASGSMKVLSPPLKFEGKEVPASIELREKGIVVSSSQNLAMIDYNGKLVYQKYFEAPREPGLVRALQYAQAVRAAYIGAASYSASASFKSAGEQVKEKDAAGGMLLEGIGQAYNDLGNAATDFAKKSFQQANARFKATKDGGNFTVVLTKQEKNNVLMKVDKDTGAVAGVIDLGKELNPDYTMDGVTGQVFYNAQGSSIISYKF